MAAGYVFGSLFMAALSSLIWLALGGSMLSTLMVYVLTGQTAMTMLFSIEAFRSER